MGFARGFIKGFVSQAIDTKVAEDQRLAEFNEKIANLYIDEKRPAFMENEKMLKERFTLLNQKDPSLAKYAVSKPDLLSSDIGFEALMKADQEYIDRVKQLNLSGINFETGAKERTMNFNEKWKPTTDNLIKNQFGKNTIDLTVPIPGGNMQPTESVDFTTIPTVPGLFNTGDGSDFTEKSEFRIRQNNAVERAIQVSGLNSKISKDDFGNISVTAIDEADQGKLDFITSETTKRYSQNFQRLDSANIGNESVAYVNTLDRASKGFKDETDKTFASYELEANSELAYSENRVIPLEGGQTITAYDLFLNKNNTLLRLYKDASTQGRRFIKKQYNALTPNKSGYYSFFKRIDEELEKEENS